MGNIVLKVREYIFVSGPTAHLKFDGFEFFATGNQNMDVCLVIIAY